MTFEQWAKKWNIPRVAIKDYIKTLGVNAIDVETDVDNSDILENDFQNQVRALAAARNVWLTRNNVGAAFTRDGHYIRFGLCNETKKINANYKSSDLIGITKHFVTEEDLGTTLGLFTAYEIKRPGWKFTGTPREKSQLAFLEFVMSKGGIGKFINKFEDV